MPHLARKLLRKVQQLRHRHDEARDASHHDQLRNRWQGGCAPASDLSSSRSVRVAIKLPVVPVGGYGAVIKACGSRSFRGHEDAPWNMDPRFPSRKNRNHSLFACWLTTGTLLHLASTRISLFAFSSGNTTDTPSLPSGLCLLGPHSVL